MSVFQSPSRPFFPLNPTIYLQCNPLSLITHPLTLVLHWPVSHFPFCQFATPPLGKGFSRLARTPSGLNVYLIRLQQHPATGPQLAQLYTLSAPVCPVSLALHSTHSTHKWQWPLVSRYVVLHLPCSPSLCTLISAILYICSAPHVTLRLCSNSSARAILFIRAHTLFGCRCQSNLQLYPE